MDNGWKPISTAPANGEMLVRGGEIECELGGPEQYKIAHVERKNEDHYSVCNVCGYSVWVNNPTEWKPV